MATKDELWGWMETPLRQLHAHRMDDPDASWADRRAFFLARLNITDPAPYPVIDALLRDLGERTDSDRDDLLASLDELTGLGDTLAAQYADPEAAETGHAQYADAQPAAGEEAYDQNAWWAFLAECGPAWNGTDEHWVPFEPWLLAEAEARGFGAPTEALLAPVRGRGASAIIAVFADYGVTIQPPEAPESQVPQEEPVTWLTPGDFAEANMAGLLAENPEFAVIPEERRMALIAEAITEMQAGHAA